MRYATTAYPPLAADLLTVIQQAVGQGITRATKAELLQSIGRRESHSFRAALSALESDGVLTKRRVRTDAGGLLVVFDLHPQFMQKPLVGETF